MDERILARYNSRAGAKSYEGKFQRKWTESVNDRNEQRLLRGLLRGELGERRVARALDVPCGYGRLLPLLREVSERVVEADFSHPLLDAASRRAEPPASGYVRATAMRLPFASRDFDLVLSVRLCHHIRDREERLRYLGEIQRVSGEYAVFTYFDHHSVKNLSREARRAFSGKRPKWTLRASEVAEACKAAGFEVVASVPMSRLFSGHRYVLSRRVRTEG